MEAPLLLNHANVLGMKRKAHFPVTILRLKLLLRILGPSKSLSIKHSLDRFWEGFLCHCLNFHHYDISNIVLYVNGVQHPSEPLTMDCSSPFAAARA